MLYKRVTVFYVALPLLCVMLGEVFKPARVPEIEELVWGDRNDSDVAVREFTVNISDAILEDMSWRLRNTKLSTTTSNNQQLGLNQNFLKTFVEYWLKHYNWREREQYFNTYPQYTTTIQGLNVHFLHVKPSTTKKSVPILMLHGWPGTFKDFYHMLPLLLMERADDFTFNIVIPSLPSVAFSDACVMAGFGGPQYSQVLVKLMERLGYKRFYVYGGDWGAVIAKNIALFYPEQVMGLYSTLCLSLRLPSLIKYGLEWFVPEFLLDTVSRSKYSPSDSLDLIWQECGYFHLHATKPDSVSISLDQSPAGTASYMLQLVSSGTDPFNNIAKSDAGIPDKFNYTDLIDNIMIYWLTGSISSSVRLYFEVFRSDVRLFNNAVDPKVPVSCPKFLNELYYQSSWLLKDTFPGLIKTTVFESGGHFHLLQDDQNLQKAMVEDLFSSVQAMMNFRPYNSIPDKT